jgi:putative endonuclease
VAGVLTGHGIDHLQHVQGAQGDVGQIADGRGHHVQGTSGIMLGTGRCVGGRQGRLKQRVHVNVQKQGGRPASSAAKTSTTKALGDAAEALALAHLQGQGLRLVLRNFHTPGRGGGEIDLIMRERDGTLVFVEVRQRSSARHGGAGASISVTKQRRIVWAARHFLARLQPLPPCRFDVVLVQGALADSPQIEWLCGAFDASGFF